MHFMRSAKSAMVVAAALVALVLTPVSAKAAPFTNTTTAPMAVSATVSSECSVIANPLAFGSYTGAALNVSANLLVTCTNTTPYAVGLGIGSGNGATETNRSMTCNSTSTPTACTATSYLPYSLHTGSYSGANWGNVTGTWVTGTGSGAQQTLVVYGVVAASQYVTPGSYNDSITVTVNY